MKIQLSLLPLLSLLTFGNSAPIDTTFNCPNGVCNLIDPEECSSGGYELTQAANWKVGTIWSTAAVDLSEPFSITAKLYFGTKDRNGADGIALVLQAQGPDVVGDKGGGMGFAGIQPSIGVEFDTYRNPGEPNNDHVALVRDGNIGSPLEGPITLETIPNFEDGQWHTMIFSWDVDTQSISVSLDGVSVMDNISVSMSSILGYNLGYVGFTASTGGKNNSHRVCIESIDGTAATSANIPKLCRSTGDPHFKSFAGRKFDNHESGWQTLYQFGAVKLEAEHARVRPNRNIMINRAWRVSYNDQIVEQGEDGVTPSNGGWIFLSDPMVAIKIIARQPRNWSQHQNIYNIFVTTANYNDATGLCADVDATETPPIFPDDPNVPIAQANEACQALEGTDEFDDCVADVRLVDDPEAIDDIVDIAVEAAIIEERIVTDLQEDDEPQSQDNAVTLETPTEAPVAPPTDPSAVYKVVSAQVGCGEGYSIPSTFADCEAAGQSSEVQQARNTLQICGSTSELVDRTPYLGHWWNATASCSIRVGENSCIWAHTGTFLYRDCTVGSCGTDGEVPHDTMIICKRDEDNSRSIGAQGDPIILGLKGQVFKFDGRDGGWYANLASKSFNWNMQFRKYPTCKEGSDVFISGIALITPRESDQQHQTSKSDILIATTPYPIKECLGSEKYCLGDGTLHISFDGGASYVSQPGDYHYASRNRVVAHNTYGACSRRWHDYDITPKQNKVGRLGGRRITVVEKKPLELLMEKKNTMLDPNECLEWIQDRKMKDDLFKQKGMWSTLHVQTPSVSFHIEYRQSNPEKIDRECDYQSLDAWMVTVSKDFEQETWQGILGETKEKIYDTQGNQVFSDRNVLLKGSKDVDYEVDGPFGTTFDAQRSMNILPW